MIIIYFQNVIYTEFWNGIVISKTRDKVSCQHSYSCNCDDDGCDTCYDHPYDFSYFVHDSAEQKYEIARIDPQGKKIPERWEEVKVGDSTTSKHYYENYIKASKGSLFKREAKYEEISVPAYPGTVSDYYKCNKIIADNVVVSNLDNYQYQLSDLNGKLGPTKECNIIIVLVKKQSRNFYYALNQQWEGGNKNDIIIIISVDDSNTIEWSDIICLAESDLFRVKLRNQILDIKTLDMSKILEVTKSNVLKYYQRKEMKNFEYLMSTVQPNGIQLLITLIINTIICLGLTIYFYKDSKLD